MIYTTNRRVWEWDKEFRKRLTRLSTIGIDMETATLFIVGHANKISRGALLLVSDMPLMPDGIKTQKMDRRVNAKFVDMHLEMGIRAMTEIGEKERKSNILDTESAFQMLNGSMGENDVEFSIL